MWYASYIKVITKDSFPKKYLQICRPIYSRIHFDLPNIVSSINSLVTGTKIAVLINYFCYTIVQTSSITKPSVQGYVKCSIILIDTDGCAIPTERLSTDLALGGYLNK